MTPTQIKTLNQLLEDKSFKGKKQLKYLLWLNTSKPKFKIGDCFLVTDYGRRIYGHPVRDFKAMITEVKPYGLMQEEWMYTLSMDVKCGNEFYTTTIYFPEKKLSLFQKCRGNRTILQEPISKHSDEMDLPL